MDEKRMQEIALAVVRAEIRHREIRLNANFRRELGNMAKKVGFPIPLEQLTSFFETLIREAVDEMFKK